MGHLDSPDQLFPALDGGKILLLPRPPWPDDKPVAIPHKDLGFDEIKDKVSRGEWMLMKTPPLSCVHCQKQTVTIFKFAENWEGFGEDVLLARCEVCPEEKSGLVMGLRPRI